MQRVSNQRVFTKSPTWTSETFKKHNKCKHTDHCLGRWRSSASSRVWQTDSRRRYPQSDLNRRARVTVRALRKPVLNVEWLKLWNWRFVLTMMLRWFLMLWLFVWLLSSFSFYILLWVRHVHKTWLNWLSLRRVHADCLSDVPILPDDHRRVAWTVLVTVSIVSCSASWERPVTAKGKWN